MVGQEVHRIRWERREWIRVRGRRKKHVEGCKLSKRMKEKGSEKECYQRAHERGGVGGGSYD